MLRDMAGRPRLREGLPRDPRNTARETRARFEYQDACVVLRCIPNLIPGGSVEAVVIEWTTDYVVLGRDDRLELVSVKHREQDQRAWTFGDLAKEHVFRDLHAIWKQLGEDGDYVFESSRGVGLKLRGVIADAADPATDAAVQLAGVLGVDQAEAARFAARLSLPDSTPDRGHIREVATARLGDVMSQLGLDHALAPECVRAMEARVADIAVDRPPEPAQRVRALAGLMRDVRGQQERKVASFLLTMDELRDIVTATAIGRFVPAGARQLVADPRVVFEWLMTAELGPAVVAVPMGWTADVVAGTARGWFRRFRNTDDLSRLVLAAAGSSVGLSDAEFRSVRALLEDPGTWRLLGNGSVEDLAGRIASCLPPGGDRAAGDSHVAGLATARGLLEFAVWDLHPGMFQRVLVARLERMETGQATRLDQVLFGLHADLADGFAGLQDRIGRVLDRLQPGAASRAEIEKYLTALISWLNADPWPQHRQFGGPMLTPAAIERKLRMSIDGEARGPDLDADELAERCQRLVILGGPGSGKTWLARRTARRCAEQALQVIRAGETPENVELPLFTTCSDLLSAAGDIRQAAVSSALNHLGDLGGSRVSAALQVLFAERNAAVLLVLDSLDEAEGSAKRIRQADTLPWRIVLTSRPTSWNRQLVINPSSNIHRVGVLQPLNYPDDVEPFIHQWFSQQPERSVDLAGQIARRPDLQKAATVPLILAFYCIIGARERLPQFRRDLYAQVLNRMLTGRWRGDETALPDLDLCLGRLRDWAWSGAAADPVSGVGRWADTFRVTGHPLGDTADSALDHIAMPLGPPDLDTGQIERRFIHRTVREHLVAEYVARLPFDQAVVALLPHLWYDPDWEYAAPAALVMHDQHDELLRRLICQAAQSDHVPHDLSVIDGGWEFRGFLARVAAESSQADWSPEIAWTIGQARVELGRVGRTANLSAGRSWQTSNRQVRDVLLELLVGRNNSPSGARALAETAGELAETAQERAQVRDELLRLAARDNDPWRARVLAEVVTGLDPTAQERAQLRETLLKLAAHHNDPWMVSEAAKMVSDLDPTARDRAQLREALLAVIARRDDTEMTYELAEVAAELTETVQERAQLREALLKLAAQYNHPETAYGLVKVAARLAETVQERAQLREGLLGLAQERSEIAGTLASSAARQAETAQERVQLRDALFTLLEANDDPWAAIEVAEVMTGLNPTAQERAELREMLFGLPAANHDPEMASALAQMVKGLDPTAQERAQLWESLLGLLADYDNAGMVSELARSAAGLAETAQDRARLWEVLLRLIARYNDPWTTSTLGKVAKAAAGIAHTAQERARLRAVLLEPLAAHHEYPLAARYLAQVVKGLNPTAQDRAQLREALLQLTAHYDDPWTASEVAKAAAGLAGTAQERTQVREALLGLLSGRDDPWVASKIAEIVRSLDPTAQEQAQLREALLRLASNYDDPQTVCQLARVAKGLDLTAQERTQLREALLRVLAAQSNLTTASEVARLAAGLAETAQERTQVREVLLGLLAAQGNATTASEVARLAAGLAETAQERTQVREVLLGLLAAQGNATTASEVAGLAAGLAETAQERTQVREVLLGLLAAQSKPRTADVPIPAANPRPIGWDLFNWYTPPSLPAARLLAVVRQNSVLAEWLAVLPSFSSLPN